jgi:molecular chaperone DnaJ
VAKRKRDYYAVLGVPRDAPEADIKRAFRELARKHHPDVSHDDAGEAFREINEAYAVLCDKDARARYDRWGHADDGATGFAAVVDAATEMISDVLRRRRGKPKGGDRRYTLELTFEEAAFGASKTITLPADGEVRPRSLTIVVAPGTKDGTIKTMKGEGDRGGDLNVLLRVAQHATFRRDGLDVRSDHTISFSQAALGAILDIETLDGPIKMRIPEGTQPERVFRIRSRGIPQAAGKTAPRGDHLVHIHLEVPTELTARQRELIEELARVSGETHAGPPARKRLIDRVRSLLDE